MDAKIVIFTVIFTAMILSVALVIYGIWRLCVKLHRRRWLKNLPVLAAKGNIHAQYVLGWQYHHGDGMPQDDAKALPLIRAAAEQDHISARLLLANAYFDGWAGSVDYAEAVRWWEKAADDEGGTDARYILGILYLRGKEIEKDEVKAAEYLRRAAESGHKDAQAELGRCYSLGIGVEQSNLKALAWFKKAARQGSAYAEYLMALILFPSDLYKALALFNRAATSGEGGAQNMLGRLYYEGLGVKQDTAIAIKWWQKAAEQDEQEAQFALANAYEKGEGLPQDIVQAYAWFDIVMDNPTADARRDALAQRMTPQDIETAKEMSKQWRAKHPL